LVGVEYKIKIEFCFGAGNDLSGREAG